MQVGKRNNIGDCGFVGVGNCHDENIRSGVTVIVPEVPCVSAVDVRGGAPGTRELSLLEPDCTIEHVDAIVLSGGSVFGLAAASGVVSCLARESRGLKIGAHRVPIVPSAIIFDLLNKGDKSSLPGSASPYIEMAEKAYARVSRDFQLGTVGAGYGASSGSLKGGLGSASLRGVIDGIEIVIGALAVVNSAGSVLMPDNKTFFAFPWEKNQEFGGHTPVHPMDNSSLDKFNFRLPMEAKNTTLALITVTANLTKSQAKRVGIMAQDGLARAIHPIHTPFDGDVVFVMAHSEEKHEISSVVLGKIGMLSANCLSRAVARGVYEAHSIDKSQLAYKDIIT